MIELTTSIPGRSKLINQPIAAVSIDFHNTIAICDRWFELEIRELVPAFLTWLGKTTNTALNGRLLHEGVQQYRLLRAKVLESGVEIDAAKCLQIVCSSLDIAVDRADIDTGLEEIMRPTLAETRPVDGSLELIKSVNSCGIPVVVVSSAVFHDFLEWTLELFGVTHLVDDVISSARAGIYKSSPEIYTFAAESIGVDPRRCVHIGDSHRFDIVTAKKAGMRTIWLNDNACQYESHSADLVVGSLHEIPLTILNGKW